MGFNLFGIVVLAVEIVTRFRPVFNVKATHAILMLVMIAGGLGMMLRGYLVKRNQIESENSCLSIYFNHIRFKIFFLNYSGNLELESCNSDRAFSFSGLNANCSLGIVNLRL